MLVQLRLNNLKPFSLNNAYWGNHKYNNNARKYREEFFEQLSLPLNVKNMEKLKQYFNPKKHCISVNFTWFIDNFFTKKGEISRASKDVDNCFKLPIDFIFNSKYEQSLQIDDKFIVDLSGKKRPSNNNFIIITIEIIDLSLLD